MKRKVIRFIKRHHLLEKNKTVLVGVSGGADSMALLHLLHSIRKTFNLQLVVLSIDHQLRGEESRLDLQYVKEMCAQWQITFVEDFLDVMSYKEERKASTQMAARTLRYQSYENHMNKYSADYLALGHHADDQIETMFMALSQVTNPSALSGIPVKRPFYSGELIRPLLCVTKAEIMNYCHSHDITPRHDPSNEDENYMRIFFRKHIVPRIKKQNENVHTTIQYLSEMLREDEQYLMKKAQDIFQAEILSHSQTKKITLPMKTIDAYPVALQRRVYQLILDYLYDELPKNLSYVHEETFLSLLTEKKGSLSLDFPKRLKIEKSYDTIHFYFDSNKEKSGFHEIIDVAMDVPLPNGMELSINIIDDDSDIYDRNKYTYICCVDDVSLPLHIRTRLPGDRMHWKGLNGSKKIKDIFIDEKIPRAERDKKLLVTDNDGTVLWLIGIRKGLPLKAAKQRNDSRYIKMIYRKG